MATGVVSNTDALLRGFASAEAFASRVRAIAGAQPPASRPSAETIERMIADLLPVCASVNAGFDAKTTTREDDLPSSADPRPSDADSATGIHTGGASAVSAEATEATEATEESGAAPALPRPRAAPRRRRDGGARRGACRAGSAA